MISKEKRIGHQLFVFYAQMDIRKTAARFRVSSCLFLFFQQNKKVRPASLDGPLHRLKVVMKARLLGVIRLLGPAVDRYLGVLE